MRRTLSLVVLLLNLFGSARAAAQYAPSVPVHVVAEREGTYTLHQLLIAGPRSHWTGRRLDAFTPLCTAPCTAQLPMGTYYFGVSANDADPQRYNRPIDLSQELTLQIDFDDRSGLRTAGWIVFAASALAAAGLVLGSLAFMEDANSQDAMYGMIFGGLGAIVVGGIISIPFVGFQDAITVRPLR